MTDCNHVWERLRDFEQTLSAIVFVRRCGACGCVQAKDGHKQIAREDGWETIVESGATGRSSPHPAGPARL